MREHDIGTVIVLEDERLIGILTEREIVVRAIAAHRDPRLPPTGAVCSRQLTTVSPADGVDTAVRLMRACPGAGLPRSWASPLLGAAASASRTGARPP